MSPVRREGSREYYAEDRADAALARYIDVIAGKWKLPRLKMDPDEFEESARAQAISEWIAANWPKGQEDPYACRHCRARYKPGDAADTLIPVGYGPRPHIWLHRACYDPYWAGVRLKALRATGFE